jgi:hypothetical protein
MSAIRNADILSAVKSCTILFDRTISGGQRLCVSYCRAYAIDRVRQFLNINPRHKRYQLLSDKLNGEVNNPIYDPHSINSAINIPTEP